VIVSRRQALALGGLGLAAAAVGSCTSDEGGDDGSGGSDAPPAPTRLAYGDAASQFADLTLPRASPDGAPDRRTGLVPVVALIHGGFWQATYDLTLMEPLAADLLARGWSVLNVEYRRVGEAGGGWPGTLADVGAALDLLATAPEAEGIDPERVITVGHSAGGHLALWCASREGLPEDAPGARPSVVPVAAVGQAAVCDLVRGADADLGGGACQSLLGGEPDEVPDRYDLASPAARLPLGVPQLLVHGTDDRIVPPAQSQTYAGAATAAGDQVELSAVPGDHFIHLDPTNQAWTTITDRLPSLLPT